MLGIVWNRQTPRVLGPHARHGQVLQAAVEVGLHGSSARGWRHFEKKKGNGGFKKKEQSYIRNAHDG